MSEIKKELFGDVDESEIQPEGLAPPDSEVPEGFERDEWEKLTEGWGSREDNVRYILSLRGQAGPKKGRPTNFKLPFKGELSTTSRAVSQRNRAATENDEASALRLARNADRAAQYQLRNKLNKSNDFKALSDTKQAKFLHDELESLAEKRFRNNSSGEWLEAELTRVHKKWDDAYHQADLRQHQASVQNALGIDSNMLDNPVPRAAQRLFGTHGVVNDISRNAYFSGLAKLESNSFESKEEKAQYQEWVKSLTPEELALYMDKSWEREEPPSIFDKLDAKSLRLHSDRPFRLAKNDDECEEEIDEDSEIEEYYASLPNEYETDEQWREANAQGDSDVTDFEGFSDDVTDFEGFSDDETPAASA